MPDAVPPSTRPEDVAATFCATLADEWVRCGVTDVVVSPGSRSTPMALALVDRPDLRVHVHHDERSGAFTALGLALGSGRPAVVLTTSGTAAAELHPAVVEAHQARVPLIAVTADRPPELRDVGAPQAIDQTHLFGRSVRWFHDPGVPDAVAEASWRSLGARVVVEAVGPPAGPVHLNLPFREPLLGDPARLPLGRPGGRPWHRREVAAGRFDPTVDGGLVDDLARRCIGRRGVVVAGRGAGPAAGELEALAELLGWPVLADPRAGCGPGAVRAFDSVLRAAPVAPPDVVLRVGEPPASKVLARWLAGAGDVIVLDADGRWDDPDRVSATVVHADPAMVARSLGARPVGVVPDRWADWWSGAEAAAQAAVDAVLAGHGEPTEPGVARAVSSAVPEGGVLVVSSSMPVRDLEWYGRCHPSVRVLANRGANGIDGLTSTAVGVALSGSGPVVALVGDVAFLHDTNGLLGLASRHVDLTIVVVDNDGGGIFSFLPQRAAIGDDRFERLFGTPHGVDVGALAAVHGLPVASPATAAEVGPVLAHAIAAGGARVVHVRTDRHANPSVHDEIHAAVAAAVAGTG